MTRLASIIGAAALLAVMGACADPQDAATPPAAQPPAQSAPEQTGQPEQSEPDRQPARTPPSGGEAVSAAQVEESALPEGYPVMVWTEDDGRTVGAVAQEGGCGKASAEVAEQGAERVVVVLVESTPATAEMCTMDLRYPKLTVELAEPLGDRQVVLKSEQRKS